MEGYTDCDGTSAVVNWLWWSCVLEARILILQNDSRLVRPLSLKLPKTSQVNWTSKASVTARTRVETLWNLWPVWHRKPQLYMHQCCTWFFIWCRYCGTLASYTSLYLVIWFWQTKISPFIIDFQMGSTLISLYNTHVIYDISEIALAYVLLVRSHVTVKYIWNYNPKKLRYCKIIGYVPLSARIRLPGKNCLSHEVIVVIILFNISIKYWDMTLQGTHASLMLNSCFSPKFPVNIYFW